VTDSATFTTPEADEDQEEDLGDLLLEVLPGDGSTIGNLSAREVLNRLESRYLVVDCNKEAYDERFKILC
jgi:hypothetical protein